MFSLFNVAQMIVFIATIAVIFAVFKDFEKFHQRKEVKKEKKSLVETGTMFLFFFLFYGLIRFRVGVVNLDNNNLHSMFIIFGLVLVVLGTVVNIKGRFDLGKNWANQIKIYEDHKMITSGMYALVRHPLYASLIWMFFGATLVYTNYLAFLANLLIFIPFMTWRAKQEEALLLQEFSGYQNYQKTTGRFFPKFL